MSASPKPKSNAVLKTLPPDRQSAIAEFAREHSLTETRHWLAADGLITSEAAISGWLSWYSLQQQLQRNESTVETLLTKLQTSRPDWTPDQLQAAGQSFFTALALEQQDAKQWFLIQQTAIKRQQLDLDRRKFQRETCDLFLKWNEDKTAKEIAASAGSHADKIERLGKAMFGEDW